MLRLFRYWGSSLLLTLAALVAAGIYFGPGAIVVTLVLVAIEIAFSFDNAVINAKVLERLSRAWQQAFLTIGIIVAVVGMRLVFPVVIVMLTAHLSWGQVVDQALRHPDEYGHNLAAAHHTISAFGGAFLLVLALYFFFDRARETLWLVRVERPLQRLGSSDWLAPLLVAVIMIILAVLSGHHGGEILRAGLIGAFGYAGLKAGTEALGKLTGNDQGRVYTGWAAALAFAYLQVLDASFSLDGVLGAFAITNQVIIIALGLGVGAVWVRSLTVFFVRQGTLSDYKYLEHGAHYAILILAVALLASLFIEVPDAITGIAGLGVIVASFVASRRTLARRLVR